MKKAAWLKDASKDHSVVATMHYIQTGQLIDRCRVIETTRTSHEICDWDGKRIRMNITCGLVNGIMGEFQKYLQKKDVCL